MIIVTLDVRPIRFKWNRGRTATEQKSLRLEANLPAQLALIAEQRSKRSRTQSPHEQETENARRRLAERLETTEKINDVQRRMLEAAARRPRDRDELAERLRDGQF